MNNSSEALLSTVSIVVPVFGSSGSLEELHRRISEEMRRLGRPYEIVFVDDCGGPASLLILQKIYDEHKDVIIVEMLRNVGQLSATVHGIAQTSGKLIVTIDDDLQQWPEDIAKLIHELESHQLDMVVARFPKKQHSGFRNISSEIARRIAVTALPVAKDSHFSSFRVMRREVFQNYFGDGPLTFAPPGWMYHTAPLHSEIEVRHSERLQGKSTYSLASLVGIITPLFKGLIDFALRSLVVVSLVQVSFAIFAMSYFAFEYFRGNVESPGFTTIVMLLLLIIGILGAGAGLLAMNLRSLRQIIVNKPSSLIRGVHKFRN
jgi:glycosyltransferase involved in cell wall biosynthesis